MEITRSWPDGFLVGWKGRGDFAGRGWATKSLWGDFLAINVEMGGFCKGRQLIISAHAADILPAHLRHPLDGCPCYWMPLATIKPGILRGV